MKVAAAVIVALGAAVAAPGVAHAEISEMCLEHLAERPGTTPAEDRRFHMSRGEFSPCTPADAGYRLESGSRDHDHREKEGRFCDGRFWC